jgi:hypothetical protein
MITWNDNIAGIPVESTVILKFTGYLTMSKP